MLPPSLIILTYFAMSGHPLRRSQLAMLQVEQSVVLVALVPKSKVDTGAVLSGGPDEVSHDARDV